MELNFDSGAYVALNRDKRAAEEQNAFAPLNSLNQTAQTVSGMADKMMAYKRQQQQDAMQRYLMGLKGQEANRETQKFNSDYGQPIDPNDMSVGSQPQPILGKSSFMPGGEGQVASPSPLIAQHMEWIKNNRPMNQAQPEFMNAMGKDERKSYFDQNSPETMADVNLKNAQAEYLRTKPAASATLDARLNNQNRSSESTLRSQFLQQSKDFADTATSFQRIVDSSKNPTAAGDLSMIYNYMKMLDPGSTVREGEFATAQNAGSIPQSILAQYNKAISGERLAPALRQDFVNRANQLYQGQKARHDQRVAEFKRIASSSNLNPDNVIVDLATPSGGFSTPDNNLNPQGGLTWNGRPLKDTPANRAWLAQQGGQQ